MQLTIEVPDCLGEQLQKLGVTTIRVILYDDGLETCIQRNIRRSIFQRGMNRFMTLLN
jgi:hypothetical protein